MQSLHSLTAHLVVRGAVDAAKWYATVFGATEFGHRLVAPDGRVMHIELRVGDCQFMIADEFPEWGVMSPLEVGGTALALEIKFADARPFWDRAVANGATVRQPLGEMFWGDLHGQIVDPYGHRWNIAQHLRDVPAQEQQAALTAMFKPQ